MMYSSGLPVLYPFACVFYFANYWMYKMLLLKYYSTTRNFNEDLALYSAQYLWYALSIHVVTVFVMLSNPTILPVSQATEEIFINANKHDYNYFLERLEARVYLKVFAAFLAFVACI